MLVLTRKPNESIVIDHHDHQICVKVLDIDGNGRVRLGIDAPEDVLIYRLELYQKIYQEQALAAEDGCGDAPMG